MQKASHQMAFISTAILAPERWLNQEKTMMKNISTLLLCFLHFIISAQESFIEIEDDNSGNEFLIDKSSKKRLTKAYDKIDHNNDYFYAYCRNKITLFDDKNAQIISKTNYDSITSSYHSDYLLAHHNKKIDIYSRQKAERIGENSYDSIVSKNDFLYAYHSKKIDILTKNDAVKLLLANARAIHSLRGSSNYQALVNNKLFWIDRDFNVLEQVQKKPISYCGNAITYRSEILNERDSLFYRIRSSDALDKSYIPTEETFNMTHISKNRLTFLNRMSKFECDSNDIIGKELDANIFIERLPNYQYNIIKIDFSKKPIQKHILVEQADKLYTASVFSPFIFEKGGLLGYYPYNKKACYTFLNPRKDSFARFMLPNGQQGWVDEDGREFLDE